MAHVRWTLQALDDLEAASLSLAMHRTLRQCLLIAPSAPQTAWCSIHV
jgi:hypothetical protein